MSIWWYSDQRCFLVTFQNTIKNGASTLSLSDIYIYMYILCLDWESLLVTVCFCRFKDTRCVTKSVQQHREILWFCAMIHCSEQHPAGCHQSLSDEIYNHSPWYPWLDCSSCCEQFFWARCFICSWCSFAWRQSPH